LPQAPTLPFSTCSKSVASDRFRSSRVGRFCSEPVGISGSPVSPLRTTFAELGALLAKDSRPESTRCDRFAIGLASRQMRQKPPLRKSSRPRSLKPGVLTAPFGLAHSVPQKDRNSEQAIQTWTGETVLGRERQPRPRVTLRDLVDAVRGRPVIATYALAPSMAMPTGPLRPRGR
jgi:hypothetical protein